MGKKVKVAFIIPALGAGGAERVVTTLANGLVGMHEIHIFTYSKSTSFYSLHSEISVHPLLEETAPSSSVLESLQLNWNLYRTLRYKVKHLKPDLLIGFLTTANVLSALVGRSLDIPVIISERNNPRIANTPRFWRIFRRISYPLANILTVQTRTIGSFYTYLERKGKIRILPNPISPDLSKRRNDTIRESIVLNVGRLTPQKDQALLIRAFAALQAPNWHLIIAGEGPMEEKLKALAEDLGISHRVNLVGRTKDIASYYNRCGIFAFPSRFEGFPNALIEAMHFGMPCIATDCPTGPSELIESGKNGFLLPVGDEEKLRESLEILIADAELRKEFGLAARKKVDKFKATTVIKQWEAMIYSIIPKT